MGILDLEKQFSFYGAYHHNPINIAIHMLLVWPIFFTALLILYFTPSFFNLPQIELSIFEIHCFLILNFGFLIAIIYSLFYIALEVKSGSLAALLCMTAWILSSFLAQVLGFSLTWKVVLITQIVCWIGQFIGHGVFEAMQKFLNYEPYPGFQAKVEALIDAEINDWKEKKQLLIS
ncbi:2-hydroxy-palmitic acid dioxygenase mpo1-like isoform X2 [Cannabis sativa]|uniref:2-hydroxy-palmitic acid dioxygenase mpo1-like isoform X2 n=1 Tax=Cannabis sativa TaxID=3483 RepID=UPI0029CA88B6|nr:2-hydroxy-palmitic acid dioxygenase mpo1-like isoform X2 [Cannabis sativa]